ncbi:MAG: dTDP-4-dehydrorhamnose reductase [Bacteroidales bacterium]|jgi:dTDP-4-dehydrorhamnose reductase|nr:dTDP-4-dehydrorhamnose reductase [Bacteroidales bacterium]
MAKKDTLKNILVTGANGQLGTSLALMANSADANFFFTDVDTLDIADYRAVSAYMKKNRIDIVINCAAYTNVDKAEDDRDMAFKINAEAPGNLAKACRVNSAALIHISTDYVFGKERSTLPRTEEVKPSPSGVYGESKLEGEERIIAELEGKEISPRQADKARYAIVRTAWLYSEYGKNFVKTMLNLFASKDRLNVVFDQVGTPTYAGDLAAVVYRIAMEIISGDWRKVDNGIYNFTDEGVCSWFDFATAIAELSGSACRVMPCHSDEFPSKVKRPSFSVLDKSKIKQRLQIEIPHWRQSLRICLNNLIKTR